MNKYLLTMLFIIITIFVGINSTKSIPDHKLHITICDVGQGDAIFITTPRNKHILVDAGPDATVEACLDRRMPFYNRTLDMIIVSHFHADHITGFVDIFNKYKVKTIVKNELNYKSEEKTLFEKEALDQKTTIEEAWQGDTIHIEDQMEAHVLWPTQDAWNRTNGNWEAYLSDFNDSSIILFLKYRNASILLTGDAGESILNNLDLEFIRMQLAASAVRIYKVPHHGSRDAISSQLINLFNPTIAVFSVGKTNTFGHPHKETLTLLNNLKIPILRTDRQGTIDIITNGDTAWVKTDN